MVIKQTLMKNLLWVRIWQWDIVWDLTVLSAYSSKQCSGCRIGEREVQSAGAAHERLHRGNETLLACECHRRDKRFEVTDRAQVRN